MPGTYADVMTHFARTLLLASLAALLSACTVAVTNGAATQGIVVSPDRSGEERILNPTLGLAAYPGSRILEHEVDGRDSETEFHANADLRTVYAWFHDQLVADGWRRTDLEIESDEIEAEYRRGGQEFELELEDEGGGRYELEIDFD